MERPSAPVAKTLEPKTMVGDQPFLNMIAPTAQPAVATSAQNQAPTGHKVLGPTPTISKKSSAFTGFKKATK